MHRFEAIDLNEYRGHTYILVGFVEPKPQEGHDYDPDEDADNYGFSLARSTEFGSNEEIVCMDTTHGRPHLDLRYLPPDSDEEKKIWLENDYSYQRMKRYLMANWQYFVDEDIRYNG